MLTEDANDQNAVVQALRNWHANNSAPPANTGIVAFAHNGTANGGWDIPYGISGGAATGAIRMLRNNFQVTHVTVGGNFVGFTYNHVWPGTLNLAVLMNALQCNNLALQANDSSRSLIILLSSECARSELVQGYIQKLLGGHIAASNADFNTIKALTAEYQHTQTAVGGFVNAGPGWRPVTMQDHLYYNTHKPSNTVTETNGIWGMHATMN